MSFKNIKVRLLNKPSEYPVVGIPSKISLLLVVNRDDDFNLVITDCMSKDIVFSEPSVNSKCKVIPPPEGEDPKLFYKIVEFTFMPKLAGSSCFKLDTNNQYKIIEALGLWALMLPAMIIYVLTRKSAIDKTKISVPVFASKNDLKLNTKL